MTAHDHTARRPAPAADGGPGSHAGDQGATLSPRPVDSAGTNRDDDRSEARTAADGPGVARTHVPRAATDDPLDDRANGTEHRDGSAEAHANLDS
ncbi:hypothetical protein, partial [Nocardia sp. NPDC058497]|uniref:hypothetical protein n=1 Tax=Nocardia sp. NPDC058497 TaxID=3346529 RepID=UPI00365CE603